MQRGFRVTADIGIVDAEDHRAPFMTGIEPVENEGPRAPDVQKARGRRRKTNSHHEVPVYWLVPRDPPETRRSTLPAPSASADSAARCGSGPAGGPPDSCCRRRDARPRG